MMKNIFILVLIITLTSCYYDKEEDLYGLECDLTNVTYATEVDRIIETSCATTDCHDGSNQNPKYDSYQTVLQDSGKIFERVIVQKNMPPGVSLQDCDFKQIDEWLRNGAVQ